MLIDNLFELEKQLLIMFTEDKHSIEIREYRGMLMVANPY